MSKFETDLNHRERAGLLKDVEAAHDSMGKLKEALATADDEKLLIEYMICTLTWHAIRTKLDKVMTDAVEAKKGADSLDQFGGF